VGLEELSLIEQLDPFPEQPFALFSGQIGMEDPHRPILDPSNPKSKI